MVPLAFNLMLLVLFGVWAVLSRNYCWNNAVLNPGPNEVRFESRLRIGHYLWIFISNIVLIIVTFGLFVPWASVRMFRYRTSCLSLHGATSLDELVAEISAEPNAVGDAASDLFDFDFGLLPPPGSTMAARAGLKSSPPHSLPSKALSKSTTRTVV
jgi:uncharacterized membrane protein YjgN (DUF898 family)